MCRVPSVQGVPIGSVTDLRVDARGQTIEIDFQVYLDRLNTIGANVERIRRTADVQGMFPTLRAQVVSNPVTGEAYLFLDAPPNPPPPLPLAFTPDRAYVPSMPTPLSALQDQLPAVLDRPNPRCACSPKSSPGFQTASIAATSFSPTSSALFRRATCRTERRFAGFFEDDQHTIGVDERAGRGDQRADRAADF